MVVYSRHEKGLLRTFDVEMKKRHKKISDTTIISEFGTTKMLI